MASLDPSFQQRLTHYPEPATVQLPRLPSTMVVLDERFVPHIIDCILENLDFPGSIVAAQVSKAWRKRANRILRRHVVAEPAAGGLHLSPKHLDHPEVRVPRYFVSHERLIAYGMEVAQRDRVLWAAWVRNGFPMFRLVHRNRELLDEIEILDIDDTPYVDCRAPPLRDSVGDAYVFAEALMKQNLSVIRQHFTDRKVFEHDGFVYDMETWVYLNITKTRPSCTYGSHRPAAIRWDSAKRVVLNIDYYPVRKPNHLPNSTASTGYRLLFLGRMLQFNVPPEELVVIVHNLDSWDCCDDAKLAASARNVVWYLNFMWARIPVVLVGVDSYFATKSVYEEFRTKLIEAASDTAAALRRHPLAPPEVLHDLGSRLHVLTHKEYQARVGRETYQLHAVP